MFAKIINSRKYGQVVFIKDVSENSVPAIKAIINITGHGIKVVEREFDEPNTDGSILPSLRDKFFDQLDINDAEEISSVMYSEMNHPEPTPAPIHAYVVYEEELWAAESESQLINTYREVTGEELEEGDFKQLSNEEINEMFADTDEMGLPNNQMVCIADWLRQTLAPGPIASAGF